MITPDPFKTYVRTVRQTKQIAEVTAENIGQIAALIGGQVDYATGEPILLVPSTSNRRPLDPWKVKVGWHIELYSGEPPSLSNANGFNRDGDWTEEQR